MTKYCGAQAWRTLDIEGLLMTNRYTIATVTCTLPIGHDGKHAGWLAFKTGVGDVNAKVVW